MDNVRTDAKTLRGCLFNYFSVNRFFNEHTNIKNNDKPYVISNIIDDIVNVIKRANFETVEKFLFVEDGSVNLDELDSLAITNREIKVIVVRQGGRIPELKEVK